MATIGYPHRQWLFLCLAFAASLIELGPIVALLRAQAGLLPILLAGLAYQTGNALPRLKSGNAAVAISLVSTLGVASLVMFPIGSLMPYLGIGMISWSLQSTRRVLRDVAAGDAPSTVEKRTARVAGFVVAAFLPLGLCGIVIWLGIIAAVAISNPAVRPGHGSKAAQHIGPLEAIMIVHQSHYFAYCYALPLLFDRLVLGGTSFVGVWFACGWVSYLLAESFWRRFLPVRVFIIGHVTVALLLVVMALTVKFPWLTVGMWILSGLGGGTVYCLTSLHRKAGLPPERLEFAEDIGHLVGIAVSLCAVAILGWTAELLPVLGAVWATTAAFAMIWFHLKDDQKASFTSTAGGHHNAHQ